MSFPTTPLARLKGHNGPVHAVTFSAGTGQYVLTGSQDRSVRLFNPSTARLIQTYSAHGYEVLDLAVSEDNARFVSVGGDKTVFLWDVATAQTLRRFTGHAGRVNCCAFGGEGDAVVVTGSFDGTFRVWDTRSRSEKAVQSFGEARDSVSSVAVQGGEIFAGSVDGRVRIYDLAMGQVDVDVLGASVTSVMPSKDGESYLASTLDSRVRLMDRRSGKCLQTFKDEGYENSTYRVRSTLAMADGAVISGGEDGRVFVWDVLSGEVMHRLWHKEGDEGLGGGTTKKDVVSAVAWNQLRKQWASAGGDGTVVVWGVRERVLYRCQIVKMVKQKSEALKRRAAQGDEVARETLERRRAAKRRRAKRRSEQIIRDRLKARRESGDPQAVAPHQKDLEKPISKRDRLKAARASGDRERVARYQAELEKPMSKRHFASLKARRESGDPEAMGPYEEELDKRRERSHRLRAERAMTRASNKGQSEDTSTLCLDDMDEDHVVAHNETESDRDDEEAIAVAPRRKRGAATLEATPKAGMSTDWDDEETSVDVKEGVKPEDAEEDPLSTAEKQEVKQEESEGSLSSSVEEQEVQLKLKRVELQSTEVELQQAAIALQKERVDLELKLIRLRKRD